MHSSISFNMLIALAFLLVVAIRTTSSFQLLRSSSSSNRNSWSGQSSLDRSPQARPLVVLHNENPNKFPENSELPDREKLVGEQYEGSVDWDAEWKKVVEDRDQPEQRPGKYKSQVEIAAIKATNKVAKNVYDASREMKDKLPSAPNISTLQGDWRFWIGILVIVSFGLSLISVAGQTQVNDSFYI